MEIQSHEWMDNWAGWVNNSGFDAAQARFFPRQQEQRFMPQAPNPQNKNLNGCHGFDLMASSCLTGNGGGSQFSNAFLQYMSSIEEKQAQEIESLVMLQNESLKLLLQEHKKQQLAVIWRRMESRTLPLLKQKEEQAFLAETRRLELEDLLLKLEAEKQSWKQVAHENEALILSLNIAFQQLKETALPCDANGSEDATSCCENNANLDEEREGHKLTQLTALCRRCSTSASSILFLPCKHLSSCPSCEPHLLYCPVCQTKKKSSMEALIV